MNSIQMVGSFLILTGAVVMAINVFRFRALLPMLNQFSIEEYGKTKLLFNLHYTLMIFFLLGYMVVLYAIITEIELIGDLFVGIIFLFGAIFVLLGILLQSRMIASIGASYSQVLTASAGLEREQGKLMETNEQLKLEIDMRKQAEEALRKSEKKYRTLFEDSRDPVAISTREGKLVDVNQAYLDLYGLTREEITDFNALQLWANTDDRSRWGQELEQKGSVKDFEVRHLKKDGTEIGCQFTTTVQRAHDGSVVGYQGIVRDVTEKRKLQAQILQSEKMASIGQLASGVAHEINNPTGFVSSNLNTLSDYQNDIFSLIKEYKKLIADLKEAMATAEYPGSIPEQMKQIVALESKVDINYILDDIPNLIKESQEGTERIKRIVMDLKDFAHPGEQKLKYANINKNFDSTLNIVWNELKYKTTVTKDYGELPKVQCYPQQMKQVFMNLLLNAAQAVEKKGEIRIVTRAVDGQVEIAISDTGSGITKENLSKIFDPFFTTKDVGKGTGLGLNIAYNIIQRHKGTIEAHSEVGKGTTFTIRIPVS